MKIANEYWSKLYLLRDALFANRTDGALVRLTTPVYPGEPEGDADKRLQDFTRDRRAKPCTLSAGSRRRHKTRE